MSEVITIGCRLPNGITLEIGYSTTIPGPNNRPGGTMLQQHEDYERVHIQGTRSHTTELRRRGMQVPAIANAEPAYTKVSKAFWERWRKEHKNSWLVKNRQLFEVTTGKGDEPERKAAAIDASATSPAILQPMDPTKKVTVDDHVVETAEFHKDNVAASVAKGAI